MLKSIQIRSSKQFHGNVKELSAKLNSNVSNNHKIGTYSNSEGPLSWILRGAIKYFYHLDSNFLGEGNATGIPAMQADHFANNYYRLANTLKYLANLWHKDYVPSKEFKSLEQIRTLIVHSGENISQIGLPNTDEYKDTQLWQIIKRKSNGPSSLWFPEPYADADYQIEISSDKHDKSALRHQSEVDYNLKNETFRDQSIYLWAADIRNIVLNEIDTFLDVKNRSTIKSSHVLPEIKDRVIQKSGNGNKINFEKIFELISHDCRGGALIENDEIHWNGFGLERLKKFIDTSKNSGSAAVLFINDRITKAMERFWEEYKDDSIEDDEIQSLDVLTIFSDCLPNFEEKNYFEGEKLFLYIAPAFDLKNSSDDTDIDYLLKFVSAINRALNTRFNLEQSVDSLVCDYIYQSVVLHLKRIKQDNNVNPIK
ncbi:MAG: hypothetical protein ABF913_03550 [Oenococcus sp.]|uniref:hypothetical protein n=1 Tax=Oenococcus sp. TaxID=1979414 RepID=UPI0039E9D61C